jgi:hypothetical protein
LDMEGGGCLADCESSDGEWGACGGEVKGDGMRRKDRDARSVRGLGCCVLLLCGSCWEGDIIMKVLKGGELLLSGERSTMRVYEGYL